MLRKPINVNITTKIVKVLVIRQIICIFAKYYSISVSLFTMTEQTLDDIFDDIEHEYGNKPVDKNVEFILSLFAKHIKEDGTLDDNIPAPSAEAAAETIILILDHPDLSWEKICEKKRVLRTMEYLFIRARNHHDEVNAFVKSLLSKYVKGCSPQMVLQFLNIWDFVCQQEKPSAFLKEIAYPDHADEILGVLHEELRHEVGRGAALIMVCAREEGLVRDIAHAKVVTEFPHISKSGYNNYLHESFKDKEKNRIISILRTKIGYQKDANGRTVFDDPEVSLKSMFLSAWNMLKFE